MRYLINYCFLSLISVLNKFGRGYYLKKKTISSRNILEKNYKLNSKFNFIQVGANDGISFDFLYEFVTKRNSSGVVIEPVKDYFNELQENYASFPNIIPVNKAAHPNQNQIIIYKIDKKVKNNYPDWVKGIASIDPKHHKKTNINSTDIIEEVVKADTLMQIINQNSVFNKIDYLQIDTEGFDYEIIKMLDFSKVKPKIIKYESVNLTVSDQKELAQLLKRKGYYLFDEFGDTVGVDLFLIKMF